MKKIREALAASLLRFGTDTRGNIAILFAVSSVAIFVGVGGGIDLARAYAARQKLSQAATLACQYSTRPSVANTAAANYSGTNGFQTYVASVNAYAAASLSSQHWAESTPTGASGTAGAYFTATPAAGGSTPAAMVPSNPSVAMLAQIPATFGQILNITSIPVKAVINCQSLAAKGQIVNPPTVLQEGFETPCSGWCGAQARGGSGFSSTPTSTFPDPTAAPYESDGLKWYVMGYCLEVDATGVINATSPEGSHTAELDCDNGSYSAGNSSISTKKFLEAGQYELRYFYRSRVDYPDYDPAYICGSTVGDISWANSTNANNPAKPGAAPRTNQINVYLDQNIVGNGTLGSAPLHTTLDNTQSLAGSNLIDSCVYSPTWIERSVKFKVIAPALYWLSFAADGASDSFGGQLDFIRICQELCPGPLQDNFPPSWLASSNFGTNKVLFEDNFETPIYSTDPFASSAHAKGGNLSNSYGTSNSPPGWPNQTKQGWATAPYNEVEYWMQGATKGNQYIALQGWNGFSNSSDPINRAISRQFLLDPGYYAISYYYTSLMDFSYDFIYGINCTYAPTVANNYSIYGLKHGHNYGNPVTVYSQYRSTDFMDVFMSNGQLISTPASSTTIGSAPTYTNPDGAPPSSASVPPDNGTIFGSYNASAVNPVIDRCAYSSGFGWVPRSVNIKIVKPGWYWLTFSAQGDPLTGTGAGPAIDDVMLTALGSPFMSNPPTSPLVAIPVPAPQPDSSYIPNLNAGFSIVADPFMPPGADQ